MDQEGVNMPNLLNSFEIIWLLLDNSTSFDVDCLYSIFV